MSFAADGYASGSTLVCLLAVISAALIMAIVALRK